MSHNVKLCGYSYKIQGETFEDRIKTVKQVFGEDKINEIIEKYGEDDFLYFIDDLSKDGWYVKQDTDGNWAFVYITDSGESFGDIHFSTSMTDMMDKMDKLTKLLGGSILVDDFQAFAVDWYNGCDSPLKY